MKVLIAIVNCHGKEYRVDVQRETWIPQVPEGVDVRVFKGRRTGIHDMQLRVPRPDEVILDCDDSYQGLPDKVRAIIRWALEHGYDFMLKCDDDVILKPVELMESGFQDFDFTGNRNEDPGVVKTPWGFCYWLSRRSMENIKDSDLPANNNDEMWIARKLYEKGIYLRHDGRYYLHRGRREDMVHNKRPLRAPNRIAPCFPPPILGTFAHCVYLVWYGLHKTPEEVVIKEMRKVFDAVQNQ